jgi:hypothetical protein
MRALVVQVKPGEDPHSNGLVLEWVYGTIVSTAEKARDGAKRVLGSYLPQPVEAHHALHRALEDQAMWESRLAQARSLLGEMLKSRVEAAELSKSYDIRPIPKNTKVSYKYGALFGVRMRTDEWLVLCCGTRHKASAAILSHSWPVVGHLLLPADAHDVCTEVLLAALLCCAQPEDIPPDDALPDHVLVAMLRREVLLTRAKLHYLMWEHTTMERQLRTWKNQLRQVRQRACKHQVVTLWMVTAAAMRGF